MLCETQQMPKVLLCYAESRVQRANDVKTKLDSTGLFSVVTPFNCGNSTPMLSELLVSFLYYLYCSALTQYILNE
jgi:hypothetical protein